MASLMPVSRAMNGGISCCGLTKVWNSPSTSPPRTFTAPISVMREPPAGDPPVVSRSTTQKVRSRNGRPSSSKDCCSAHRGGSASRRGPGASPAVMGTTVGKRSDSCATTRGGPRS